VPVSGYYEWRTLAGKKQPFYVSLPQQNLFALAGICTNESFAIVTLPAQDKLLKIHDRMPLALHPSQYTPWLLEKTALLNRFLKIFKFMPSV
jgi:putative SOS response-associated peptidase YedK